MDGWTLPISDWRLCVKEVVNEPQTDMPHLTMDDVVSKQVSEVKEKWGKRHVVPTTKEDLCRDLCMLIRQTDWSILQVKALYECVVGKTISKSCAICKRLTSVFDGEPQWIKGDMSKPKQFICKGCATRL